jgi:hypothetical protein
LPTGAPPTLPSYFGSYKGSYSGAESGTLFFRVDAEGSILGTGESSSHKLVLVMMGSIATGGKTQATVTNFKPKNSEPATDQLSAFISDLSPNNFSGAWWFSTKMFKKDAPSDGSFAATKITP